MKRILILCIACVVLMASVASVASVASAEVNKGMDSFTGGLSVSSSVDGRPMLEWVTFSKTTSGDLDVYELKITETQLKKYSLSDFPVLLSIDDHPVYELSDYRYKISGPDSYGVEYSSSITTKIPLVIIDSLKSANRIALRCEDNNMLQRIYVLPDNVLAEWKEVINTEK